MDGTLVEHGQQVGGCDQRLDAAADSLSQRRQEVERTDQEAALGAIGLLASGLSDAERFFLARQKLRGNAQRAQEGVLEERQEAGAQRLGDWPNGLEDLPDGAVVVVGGGQLLQQWRHQRLHEGRLVERRAHRVGQRVDGVEECHQRLGLEAAQRQHVAL
jgi:hypothetical protein